MTIERVNLGGIGMLRVAEWTPRLLHGGIGSELDFSTQAVSSSATRLCERCGAQGLFTVSQVHGADVVDLTVPGAVERLRSLLAECVVPHLSVGTGDALLLPILTARHPTQRLLAGIRTADCVPFMVVGARICALVHAGWRGVAAGIVERVMALFKGESEVEAFIAPCAGGAAYEVGIEVVAAVQGEQESRPRENGKFLLDLGETVARRIRSAQRCQIHRAPQCTISSTDWHSYRRDGSISGRNLLFAEL